MSVTNKIFGRWELAVADDVYIRNGSGTNIGAQTYNTYQYPPVSVNQSVKTFPHNSHSNWHLYQRIMTYLLGYLGQIKCQNIA